LNTNPLEFGIERIINNMGLLNSLVEGGEKATVQHKEELEQITKRIVELDRNLIPTGICQHKKCELFGSVKEKF
jgi:hypothetical protein